MNTFIYRLLLLSISILSLHTTANVELNKLPDNAVTYTVAIDAAYPPFTFRDDKGIATGMDVDLLQAAGIAAGFKINPVPMDWNKWVEILDNNSADIWIGGIVINDERKQKVLFSEPYYPFGSAVIVRNDEIGKTINLSNFENYRLAALKDSVDFHRLNDQRNASLPPITEVNTIFLGIKEVATGKSDGFIGNAAVLQYHANKLSKGKLRVFAVKTDNTVEQQLGFAVKKGKNDIIQKINAGLVTIKENGTYQKIIDKWLGQSN